MPCVEDLVVWCGDIEGCYLVGCEAKGLGLVDIVPEARVDFVGV